MDLARVCHNHQRWMVVFLLVVVLGSLGRIRVRQMTPLETLRSRSPEPGAASSSSNHDTAILAPGLRDELCPKGVPNLALGPKLLAMGRVALGLQANDTAAHNAKAIEGNRKNTVSFFWDGGFGYTLFLDSTDASNSPLFVPIWKCANDQIHSYLERVFHRKADGSLREENVNTKNDTVGRKEDYYLERLSVHDMEFLFYEEIERQRQPPLPSASTNSIGKNLAFFTFNETERTKPCVFAVVRDPIAHFMSGYNEVEYRLLTGGRNDTPDWNNATERSKMASYTHLAVDQGLEERKQRFSKFVTNLLKEHPSFSTMGYYKHVASMSRTLPTLSRLGLLPHDNEAWYLSSLTNLTETFPQFLAHRCPKLTARFPLPPMKRRGKHPSSGDPYGTYQAARDVVSEQGPVAKALCVLHAVDYACYDQLLASAPKACRDIYRSEAFANELLGSSV